MLSDTTTSKLQLAVFDDASVAVSTMFVVPTPTFVPGAGTCVTTTPGQLSAGVASASLDLGHRQSIPTD